MSDKSLPPQNSDQKNLSFISKLAKFQIIILSVCFLLTIGSLFYLYHTSEQTIKDANKDAIKHSNIYHTSEQTIKDANKDAIKQSNLIAYTEFKYRILSDDLKELNQNAEQLNSAFEVLSEYFHYREKTCQNVNLADKEKESRIEMLNDIFEKRLIKGSSASISSPLFFGENFSKKIDDTYNKALNSLYALNPCSNKIISEKEIINDRNFIKKETSKVIENKEKELIKLRKEIKKSFKLSD
jgi:hypothetical protein